LRAQRARPIGAAGAGAGRHHLADAYPAPIRHLLAEALVFAALLGALLKDVDGQLTMQAQTRTRLSICWCATTAAGTAR